MYTSKAYYSITCIAQKIKSNPSHKKSFHPFKPSAWIYMYYDKQQQLIYEFEAYFRRQ